MIVPLKPPAQGFPSCNLIHPSPRDTGPSATAGFFHMHWPLNCRRWPHRKTMAWGILGNWNLRCYCTASVCSQQICQRIFGPLTNAYDSLWWSFKQNIWIPVSIGVCMCAVIRPDHSERCIVPLTRLDTRILQPRGVGDDSEVFHANE